MTMRIVLVGATGQMGRVVTEVVKETPDAQVVAGVSAELDVAVGYPIYSTIDQVTEAADVIIDFSTPVLAPSISAYAAEKNIPAVFATTGFTEDEKSAIVKASEKVGILQSGNMSLGINLLESLVKQASKILREFDVEIIEKHHNQKKDAPSGTAKMLAEAANSGRDGSLRPVYGREGRECQRKMDDIGVHAIRGGTIVGEHQVLFAGTDEVVSLTHQAHSKKIFAKGALTAARFVCEVDSGFYTMEDIFNR